MTNENLYRLFGIVEKILASLPGFVNDYLWDTGIMDEYVALKKECKWTFKKSKS